MYISICQRQNLTIVAVCICLKLHGCLLLPCQGRQRNSKFAFHTAAGVITYDHACGHPLLCMLQNIAVGVADTVKVGGVCDMLSYCFL